MKYVSKMRRMGMALCLLQLASVNVCVAVGFTEDFSSASLDAWGGMGVKAEIVQHGGRADGVGVVAADGEKGSGLSRGIAAVPGSYEFTYWAKPVGVTGTIGVRGGVEFYDQNGKFLFPYFYGSPSGEPDAFGWYKVVIRIPRIPTNAVSISTFCQLAPGSTGRVYFDDISFRSAVSPLLVAMTSPLGQTAIPGNAVRMQIVHANGDSLKAESDCTVRVTGGDGFPSLRLPVAADGSFSFAMPERPDGACPLTIELENAPEGAAPRKLTFPLNVLHRSRRVTFDALGRMFVDGKPFMPLGFYSHGASDRERKCLAECGANVLLPYGSFGGLGHTVEDLRKTIRELDEIGVKTIFSVKDTYAGTQWARTSFAGVRGCEAVTELAVKGLRDCPGLLSWYTNDEMSFSDVLVKRRDQIAALDPDHPAFVEVYQSDAAAYRRTADVFGVACYPVADRPPAETAMPMETTERSVAAFGEKGNPVWGIPQCHNSVVYGKKGARVPIEEEMRTIALHFAGIGCKGFIFYMLADLWGDQQLPDGETAFTAHWPEVRRVFAFLRSFEPWIMSSSPVRRLLDDRMTGKGSARVYRFRDDVGRDRIVFVGGGPGECEVRVNLHGKWKSRFGRAAEENGEWVFRAVGLGSDVLEPF